MKSTILFLGLTLFALGCGEKDQEKGMEFESELIVRQSAEEFESLTSEGASNGDPISFDKFIMRNDSVFLSVYYYGGCERHSFELVWNETFTSKTPSLTAFVLIHNDNNDDCREFIHETLAFSLSELSYPSGRRSVAATVFSAEATVTLIRTGYFNPPQDFQLGVVVQQSEECMVEVTGKSHFCKLNGKDLIVMELNDSISYDGLNYFTVFLFAAEMPEDQQDFVLEVGKKYMIGATTIPLPSEYYENLTSFSCSDEPIGALEVVRVNCISEINP
jgi:hypothetical protein